MAKKLLLFAFFLVLMALIVGCAAVNAVAYPNPFSPEIEEGLTMTISVAMDLPPPAAMDKTCAESAISMPRFEATERNVRPNMKYTGNENADGRGETTAFTLMNGGGLSTDTNMMMIYSAVKKAGNPQLCDQGVARSPDLAGDAVVFFANWVNLHYTTLPDENSATYAQAMVNASNLTVWYYHTGKTPAADNGKHNVQRIMDMGVAVICESGSTMAA